MRPQEKAKELVDMYLQYVEAFSCKQQDENAKQCALIAVDEILKLDVFDCNEDWSNEDGDTREYWEEVKQEIEKI